MIFDDAPIADTEGALLVHSLRVGARVFKKGRCLTADDIEKLQDAEYVTITVIRYEDDDLDEVNTSEEERKEVKLHRKILKIK